MASFMFSFVTTAMKPVLWQEGHQGELFQGEQLFSYASPEKKKKEKKEKRRDYWIN